MKKIYIDKQNNSVLVEDSKQNTIEIIGSEVIEADEVSKKEWKELKEDKNKRKLFIDKKKKKTVLIS